MRLSKVESSDPAQVTFNNKRSFWPETAKGWFELAAAALFIIATLVTVAWYLGGLIVDRHIQTALTPTQTSISDVKADLIGLKARFEELARQQARINLRSASGLTPRDFAANLSDVRSTIAIAAQQKVKVSQDVLTALSTKLQQVNPGTAGYWPAVAEFISYRSTNLVSPATSSIMADSAAMQDCADTPPPPLRVTSVQDDHHFQTEVPTYENCRITLDSKKDIDAINDYLLKQTAFLNFKHCLVVYNGGAVDLLFYRASASGTDLMEGKKRIGHTPTKITGKSVTFEECLFVFSIPNKPATAGAQKMTENLLVQNRANVELPYGHSGQ